MQSKFLILAGLALAVIISSPWAAAQESGTEGEQPADQAAAQSEEQAEQATEQPRVFTDRVVVTASRQEEASADTPATITVIDRQLIDQLQPEKMADLFKNIPGVEIDGEGPFRGLPVIRGFSSNRVLILVDGQRLNNARESTTFAGIQPGLVNLAQVERIEVLRGPASVQYGSDAIGGVINIITRAPDMGGDRMQISGDVAYAAGSSSEAQDARAQITGTGKGFSFQIGAVHQDAKDYKAASGAKDDERFAPYVDEDNRVFNSGMQQSAFDGSFRFLTGDQGVFKVNLEVVRTKDVGFPGFDLENSGTEISFPNFDRDKLGLSWNSGPVWGLDDISLSAYYQAVDKESASIISAPNFSFDRFTRSQIDSLGFNAQGIANVGINRLTFGLDFYRDNAEDATMEEICGGPFCETSNEVSVPKSHQTGLGAYIQDRITVSDRVTVHAGLRGDTFDFISEDDPNYTGEPFDVSDSAVSGNVGLTWGVSEHVNLNAVVARGFRTPNLQERSFSGFATTGDVFIEQNPFLESESSLNYELGFKVRYDRYFGGLTVFYNDVNDFITLEFLNPEQTVARLENIDKATIQGIELDLETIFADWWTLFLNYAYARGDNDITNEPLAVIPPQKVILGIRYQRARWWSEASTRIVSSQDRLPLDDPRLEEGGIPGFTVYDLRGGYDFDFGLGLVLAVENVTDKLYAEPFNLRPEPGRNFRGSIRYRF